MLVVVVVGTCIGMVFVCCRGSLRVGLLLQVPWAALRPCRVGLEGAEVQASGAPAEVGLAAALRVVVVAVVVVVGVRVLL